MVNKDIDPINELRQVLYPIFKSNGVMRAVAYLNKDREGFSENKNVILMVESGLKGIDFCVLLDQIYSAIENEFLSILDIHHFRQWSEIDNELALEGTEIYLKEKSNNKINQGYLKEIRDVILKVQKYCNVNDYKKFEGNSMLTEACEYNLQRIGKLTDCIDIIFKEENPQIPWNALHGFQWSLTSTLPGANKLLIWEIIQADFPEVLEKIEYIIKSKIETGEDDIKDD